MGLPWQVPLSARFLLYRAVRGAWQRCGKAAQAQHNRTYIPLAAWQDKQRRQRIYHCHQIFAHSGGGGIFLLTLRPTSIRKVHLRVSRKNATSALRPTTVNGHSIFEKRYTESFSPTVQQAIRAFCRLCLFLFQSPAFSFRQG